MQVKSACAAPDMLLIDAGNSRCKWAWLADGRWMQRGVLDNHDQAAWQQLRAQFAALPQPAAILVSNVAGAEVAGRLLDACAIWPVLPEFVLSRQAQCGVRNGYDNPAQLGSDRWCALIAAWHQTGQACLVVNAGTATTVDALSAGGEFLGGLIVPGIRLMQQSLAGNTAQLEMSAGHLRRFPRNTADAIHSGAVRATAAAILRQKFLLEQETGNACPLLVGGGAANILLPELDGTARLADDLVLQGLNLIIKNNSI